MSDPFDAALNRLTVRFDVLKTRVWEMEALASLNAKKWDASSKSARADAVVFGMAELEALFRHQILDANAAINAENLTFADAKPCLRQLGAHPIFESLRDSGRSGKMWDQRAQVTVLESSAEIVKLQTVATVAPPQPLDGRTLTPQHVGRVLAVYGLPELVFASSAWQGSLLRFRTARNDFAHGNIPFDRVFQDPGMSSRSVVEALEDIQDLAVSLTVAWIVYFDKRLFLR